MNSRYVHDLVIRRTSYDDSLDARDEDGQPAEAVTETGVRGLVQPRTGDELPDSRSAGSEIAGYVVYLPIDTEIRHADAIGWGERLLQVRDIRPFEFGNLTHLEVDADLVTTTTVTQDAS